MDTRAHWEQIYSTREAGKRSWTETVPATSLELIAHCTLPPDAPMIDVGGGASELVDVLHFIGYTDLTVLDISAAAIEEGRARIGESGNEINWIVADVLEFQPTRQYQLWHDRAVFHFLTDPADRAKYLATMHASVESGGYAIIATFALDGPTECSGLPVQRYDAASLAAELGGEWRLIESRSEMHETPWGTTQSFVYGLFRHSQ